MEAGVIVYAFILAGFITLCGVGFFVWINRRESELDDQSYEHNFDPGSMVEKYRHTGKDEDADIDPTKAFKRYAHPVHRVDKPQKTAPEVSINIDTEAGNIDTEAGDSNPAETSTEPSSGSTPDSQSESLAPETENISTSSTPKATGADAVETAAVKSSTIKAGSSASSPTESHPSETVVSGTDSELDKKKERDPEEFAPPSNKSD
jgi:hypothetical protein